ncbi:hypothetical protein DFH09DRAFT_1383486 [Mycena vulgaris]|nr:hypothetical protein DFH09DRAFT_1383486 [Mycena vulgaris]
MEAEFPLKTALAYMPWFPNTESLHLNNTYFNDLASLTHFLGGCSDLKALVFFNTTISESESELEDESEFESKDDIAMLAGLCSTRLKLCSFNLTGLEELAVRSSSGEMDEWLLHLVELSPPTKLKSFSFDKFMYPESEPCSITAMEKILRLNAPSLINLAVEPLVNSEVSYRNQSPRIFGRLPTFLSLQSLTIWLGPNREAERLVETFPAASNLSTIIFRIGLEEDEENCDHFAEILRVAFPWDKSTSMKSLLKRKFPLIQRIGFHFCAPRESDMHFRRGLHRAMERRLKERLEKTRADVAEYLEMEWLDGDYNPVAYSKKNGKPLQPWNVFRQSWHGEPEPEASDCDWDSDSDGSIFY